MSFLQKIDELFEASCLQFSVPLKSDNFHTYIPIEIYNDTHRFQFLIRKGKKSNFEKKTLCKYISIIDYYHNASTYSKVFLKGLGYPVKYAQSSNYISTQNAFKEIDCVEKFDISWFD